jgi:WD40 repeat protein
MRVLTALVGEACVARDAKGHGGFGFAAAGALVVGAANLVAGLAMSVAAAGRFPGPLVWIERDPWQVSAGALAVSALCWGVGWRRARSAGGRQPVAGLAGAVAPVASWVVARTETVQAVEAVLSAGAGGAVGITGLYGAGGFGKSTVARMVCADAGVRARFGDRVHWVTVGLGVRSRSEVAGKVAEVTTRVTGEGSHAVFPDDPEAAGAHLGRLMAQTGGPILLVLDDVWTQRQLEPFLAGAPNCVRLVTTRRPGVLPMGAARVLVDQLTPAQAAEVLTRGLPPGTELSAQVVERLVAACARWALLARLAGQWLARQIATGGDPEQCARALIERLNQDPTGVDRVGAALEIDDPARRNELVEASVQASLSLLSPADRKRFAELGALPADDPVPVAVLARWWGAAGLDDAGVRETCAQLAGLGLLELDPAAGGAVVLHDVLHDYACAALGPEAVREVCRALVDAVEAELPGAAPGRDSAAWWLLDADAPGARYLMDHAVELVERAYGQERAAALASDLRWVEARLVQRDVTAPIADLGVAGGARAEGCAADLVRIAHLLVPVGPGGMVGDTLRSYLQPLPAWRDQADALAALPCGRARLVNAWPPADAPVSALRRVLSGHSGPVHAVALSHDGTWLASGGDDEKVRVWDRNTGTISAILTGHSGWVHAVAVSPDGTWLASGGRDHTIRIWDRATEAAVATLTGHSSWVYTVAVSPDGAWLASGGRDRTVRIWDRATGALRFTLGGHAGAVYAVAISPDGTWLASAGLDRTVRVWDRATGALTATLTGHTDAVQAVAISPDGTWLATGSRDHTVRIWSSATSSTTAVFSGYPGWVNAVAIGPNGGWLATGSRDRTARVWDRATGTVVATLTGHSGTVHTLALSPDGAWLATGGNDHTIRVWDLTEGTLPGTRTGPVDSEHANAVAVSPDGTWLASGGGDGTVRIWDRAAGTIATTLIGHLEAVNTVAFDPDGACLATGSNDRTVRLWDPATAAVSATLVGHAEPVNAVVFGPDGTWLASGGGDGTVRIWDRATGTVTAVLTRHTGAVNAVAVSPDGTWLATGGNDHTVRVWDQAAGAVTAVLVGHTGPVYAVAISPDGTWLASGGGDGTVRIWDRATGTVRGILTGHTGTVNALAVSPDGNWLGTGSRDHTVRIWDTSGICLAGIRTDQPLRGLAWGTVLAVVGTRGVNVYDFSPGSANVQPGGHRGDLATRAPRETLP